MHPQLVNNIFLLRSWRFRPKLRYYLVLGVDDSKFQPQFVSGQIGPEVNIESVNPWALNVCALAYKHD